MLSKYISYYYQDSPYKQYHDAKEDLKTKYSMKALSDKALAVWKQAYGAELPQEVQSYMNFMFSADAAKSLQASLQQVINIAPFGGVRDLGKIDATKEVYELQEIFDQVKKVFSTFDDSYLSKTFSTILNGQAGQALIAAAISNNTLLEGLAVTAKGHTTKVYKDKLYAAVDQIKDGIKDFAEYKKLSTEMKSAINSISSAYAQLKILESLLKDQSFVEQGAADHFFRAYFNNVQRILGVQSGIVAESYYQELINENIPLPNTPDTITESIAKMFAEGTGRTHSKIQSTSIATTAAKGTSAKGREMKTVVSTSDIRFRLVSTGAEGLIDVPLPGISLKETTSPLKEERQKSIRIKSKAVLFKLLHDMPQEHIYYLLNFLYASVSRKYVRLKGKGDPEKTNRAELNHTVKAALVANGLIGQMTTEDFAYLFMLNGRVYTVPQVIQSVLTDNGTGLNDDLVSLDFQGVSRGGAAYRFIRAKNKTSSQAAWERSGNVQDYLLNQVTVQIDLKLSKDLKN